MTWKYKREWALPLQQQKANKGRADKSFLSSWKGQDVQGFQKRAWFRILFLFISFRPSFSESVCSAPCHFCKTTYVEGFSDQNEPEKTINSNLLLEAFGVTSEIPQWRSWIVKSNHSQIQPAKVVICFIKSIKPLFKEPVLEHCSTKYIFPSLWLLSFLPSLPLLPLSFSHSFAFSLHVISELLWVFSLQNSVRTRVCPLCSPGWRPPHGSLAKVPVVPLWPLAFLWHCSQLSPPYFCIHLWLCDLLSVF